MLDQCPWWIYVCTFRFHQGKGSEFCEQKVLKFSVSGVQCDVLHIIHHDVLHTNVRVSTQRSKAFL